MSAARPRDRPRWPPAPVLALVPLVILSALAAPASAHADLVSAQPAPNSELSAAPTRITASFSEPLEDTYTSFFVEGPDGNEYARETRVDTDDRRRVAVTLEPMPDGIYTIRWRTLSQADGHTRSGSYLLGVNESLTTAPGSGSDGTGDAPAGEGNTDTGEGGPLEATARGLGFVGASLAFGLPLVVGLTLGVDRVGRLRRILSAASAMGAALAALAGLALAATTAARIDADLATTFATTNGAVLLQRIGWFAAAAIALVLAARGPVGTRHAWAGLGALLAGLGLLATSLGGHAAAEARTLPQNVALDWLHQAAVAFWLSGLVALVVAGVLRLPETTGAVLLGRFSPAATLSVIVIVVTGLAATMDRLPTWDALWRSTFGILVIVKVLLLLPLVALGAYHRYRVLPRLRTVGDEVRDVAALRRSAGAEVILMVIVLLVAGALTTAGPPTGIATEDDPSTDEGPTPFATFAGDDLDLLLFVEPLPPTVGFQDLTVHVVPHDPDAVNLSAVDVYATFVPPSDPYGEASPIEAHNFGGGRFHFGGAIFTETGEWTMRLSVQGDAFQQATFTIDVAPRS